MPALWLRHDASLAHDIPGHPERPGADPRAGGGDGPPRLVRGHLLEAPEADRALLQAVHPGRYVLGLEEFCLSGGGFIDADTVAIPETFEAALRAAGGAVALVDGLLGGAARTGVSALGRLGITPSPVARWASASSATWRWGRGAR